MTKDDLNVAPFVVFIGAVALPWSGCLAKVWPAEGASRGGRRLTRWLLCTSHRWRLQKCCYPEIRRNSAETFFLLTLLFLLYQFRGTPFMANPRSANASLPENGSSSTCHDINTGVFINSQDQHRTNRWTNGFPFWIIFWMLQISAGTCLIWPADCGHHQDPFLLLSADKPTSHNSWRLLVAYCPHSIVVEHHTTEQNGLCWDSYPSNSGDIHLRPLSKLAILPQLHWSVVSGLWINTIMTCMCLCTHTPVAWYMLILLHAQCIYVHLSKRCQCLLMIAANA